MIIIPYRLLLWLCGATLSLLFVTAAVAGGFRISVLILVVFLFPFFISQMAISSERYCGLWPLFFFFDEL